MPYLCFGLYQLQTYSFWSRHFNIRVSPWKKVPKQLLPSLLCTATFCIQRSTFLQLLPLRMTPAKLFSLLSTFSLICAVLSFLVLWSFGLARDHDEVVEVVPNSSCFNATFNAKNSQWRWDEVRRWGRLPSWPFLPTLPSVTSLWSNKNRSIRNRLVLPKGTKLSSLESWSRHAPCIFDTGIDKKIRKDSDLK